MKQFLLFAYFLLFAISYMGDNFPNATEETTSKNSLVENALSFSTTASKASLPNNLPYGPDAFVTRWKTYISETPINDRITIPTVEGEIYNYEVDWGDGTGDTGVTGNITHIYDQPGTYTVSITGTFPRIRFSDRRLLQVLQWGTGQWSSMESAFSGCTNLDVTATDVPDLSRVYSLAFMFNWCESLVGNDSFNNWDTGGIIYMRSTFERALVFNAPIANWNTSAVYTMENMFSAAWAFNQDIGDWDVSRVDNLDSTFSGALSFDQDLGRWDVSNVRAGNMNGTFSFTPISTENYDKLLMGWSKLPSLQPYMELAVGSQYCEGFEARQHIIDTFNWLIADNGKSENCTFKAPYITTWKTDNPGTSESNQVRIPTVSGYAYNFSVDWGDGSTETGVTGSITHTYATAGTYTISINGEFPGIQMGGSGEEQKLLRVEQWGEISWQTFEKAYQGCINLDIVTTAAPWSSNVTNFSRMFADCSSLVYNASIDRWDTSNATNMSRMFERAEKFNQPIEYWDTGNVIRMDYMFHRAYEFNQEIGAWNVSKVQKMYFMLAHLPNFEQNLSRWNTGQVDNMFGMFYKNAKFNSNIANWNTAKVTNMEAMFLDAGRFNQPIGNWDVSMVTNMGRMFQGSYMNQDLGNWDISNVTNMRDMFKGLMLSTVNYDGLLLGWADLPSLQSGVTFNVGNSQYCAGEEARQNLIDTYGWSISDAGVDPTACGPSESYFVSVWNTANTTNSAWVDNQVSIPVVEGLVYNFTVDWGDGSKTSGVTGTTSHTYEDSGIYTISIIGEFPAIRFLGSVQSQKLIEIKQWGDIAWTTMEEAFSGCTNLDVTATDSPDLSRVTNLSQMFEDCSSLVYNPTINNWETGNIANMSKVFNRATVFNQPIGNWNMSNVTRIDNLLHKAYEFNQPIGNWDVSQVTNMSFSLAHLRNFNQDISQWDTGQVNIMFGLFYKNAKFNQNISNWNTGKVTNMEALFLNASTFNQPLGSWDVSKVVNMSRMFRGSSMNQDLNGWNIVKVTNMRDMFKGLTLSTAYYDNMLRGWNYLPSLQQGVVLDAGNSLYCDGADVRQNIIDTYGWTIQDGGLDVDACEEERPFITTWRIQDDNTVTIPVFRDYLTYNFDVDWGDGSSDSGVTGTITHTYAAPGDYSVSISGIFPSFSLEPEPILYYLNEESPKLRSVDQWGTIKWKTMAYAFAGCSNMEVKATDVPDLSQTTVMGLMFANCTSMVGNDSFNSWDTSNIKTMNMMFKGAREFNAPIGNWDVSNVGSMWEMFYGARTFNQDIGNWDVGQVVDIVEMFHSASSFNQDIGNWDVSNAVSFVKMFEEATSFNQDIGNWDVGKVYAMNYMFYNAVSFNQNLGNWDVSNVISMEDMLIGQRLSVENYDKTLIGWSKLPSLKNGVFLSAEANQYCAAATARQHIIDTYGWLILDGGENCSNLAKNDSRPKGNEIENGLPMLSFGTDIETGLEYEYFDMTVYPNPSSINVNVSFGKPMTITRFQLFDITGRLVRTQKINTSKSADRFNLDVRSLETGTYFLRAFDAIGRTYQKRLIIKI